MIQQHDNSPPNGTPFTKLGRGWWKDIRSDPNLTPGDWGRLADLLYLTQHQDRARFSWRAMGSSKPPCECIHPIAAGQAKVSTRYLASAWACGKSSVGRWLQRMEKLGYLRTRRATEMHPGTCQQCGSVITWPAWHGRDACGTPPKPASKRRNGRARGATGTRAGRLRDKALDDVDNPHHQNAAAGEPAGAERPSAPAGGGGGDGELSREGDGNGQRARSSGRERERKARRAPRACDDCGCKLQRDGDWLRCRCGQSYLVP